MFDFSRQTKPTDKLAQGISNAVIGWLLAAFVLGPLCAALLFGVIYFDMSRDTPEKKQWISTYRRLEADLKKAERDPKGQKEEDRIFQEMLDIKEKYQARFGDPSPLKSR